MSRKVLLIPMTIAAVGAPYLIYEEGWRESLSTQVSSVWPGGDATPTSRSYSALAGSQVAGSQDAATMHDMYAVLRFDRSVMWVTSNWKRVSVFDAEANLRGMRVPLVTGTQPDDLAGALTYYFDDQKELQRITFQGRTSDQRKLVDLLTSKFHLKQDSAFRTGFYVSRWHGKPLSYLQVSQSPRQRDDSALPTVDVTFELNWPTTNRGLSASSLQLVNAN